MASRDPRARKHPRQQARPLSPESRARVLWGGQASAAEADGARGYGNQRALSTKARISHRGDARRPPHGASMVAGGRGTLLVLLFL